MHYGQIEHCRLYNEVCLCKRTTELHFGKNEYAFGLYLTVSFKTPSFETKLKRANYYLKHASLKSRTEQFLTLVRPSMTIFFSEVFERCMHCFKDFPFSELIHHTQNCSGDMSGSRERFQVFTPSVHYVSMRKKRIILIVLGLKLKISVCIIF